MKKTVLTFGLVSGALLSAMMLVTVPFMHRIGSEWGLLIGYTTMVLAFLLVYFGVRSYRDNVGGGTIRFGRALAVGGLIALLASACYVATWQVVYYNFAPNFLREYQARALEELRAGGASPAEVERQRVEMEEFAVMYDNPAFNAAVTLMEPLPVALVFTLVSAGVLSRRRREKVTEDEEARLAGQSIPA